MPVWDNNIDPEVFQEQLINNVIGNQHGRHNSAAVALYVFTIIEEYRNKHNLSRYQVFADMYLSDSINYLADNYSVLHTQSNKNAIQAVEQRIALVKAYRENAKIIEEGEDENGKYQILKIIMPKSN